MNSKIVFFIPWVIIQYYTIILPLKFFQFWPVRTLFACSCVTLTYHHHYGFLGVCEFFTLSYLLSLQDVQGSSCAFPVPILESGTSSKVLFLLLENGIRTQGLCGKYTVATRVSKFISYSFGGWKSKIRVSADLVWWRPSSRLQTADFMLCPYIVDRELWRVSFIRTLIPFMRALPSWLIHLPGTPPPNSITLGIGLWVYELGRDTNIQSIAFF